MQTTTDSNVRDEQSSAAVPPSDTNLLLRHVRRVLVFLFGISVLLVGIAMIIGPGPAVVVIPLGLGILATEFLWARRILDSLKRRLADAHTVAASAELPGWLRFFTRAKNDNRKCSSAQRCEERDEEISTDCADFRG
jgi:tellurite resistance protein TerC